MADCDLPSDDTASESELEVITDLGLVGSSTSQFTSAVWIEIYLKVMLKTPTGEDINAKYGTYGNFHRMFRKDKIYDLIDLRRRIVRAWDWLRT